LVVQLALQTKGFQAVAQTSRGIYEMLKSQIADRQLAAGAQLPSTRALAFDLGVSRTTVVAVYEQLAAEGYIETSQGARSKVASGVAPPTRAPATAIAPKGGATPKLNLSSFGRRATEVAPTLPHVAGSVRSSINFLYGALSPADFPAKAWRKAYDRGLLQRQDRLYYAAAEGEFELRTELQGYLRRARGLVCEVEQILIVNGAQQAIDLCARMLLDPGDRMVMEEPCYQLARQAFEAIGAKIAETPVDEQGLMTQCLPKERAALAYVTPSHQFPLGGVMPIARRQELLAWAQRNCAWIVEDDYDGEFRYGLRPIDTLYSIDEAGTVIYVGTFSKALSPQLRIGYMVLPPQLVAPFRQAKRLTDRHTPRLEQVAMASIIRNGAYERHVRRSRRKNEQRRATLLQAIKTYLPADALVEGAASGLHLVVWFESLDARDETTLVARAQEAALGVWPISPMYALGSVLRKRQCAGLVLGYAGLEPVEIDLGIRRLAAALARVA
jgi:GntR family transcriptional regulator / MocR family aminotransferase